MKNLICCLLIIVFGSQAFSQSKEAKKMPITSASEKAKMLYNEGMIAAENFQMAKSLALTTQALKEDPDFFMAHYMLALSSLFYNDENKFMEHARNAINCKAKLDKGELLLKDAMGKLLENRKADVTEYGKKLVEIYPQDVNAYEQLYFFQNLIKDYKGVVATIKSAINVAERPAYLYNALGYGYMGLKQYKEAVAAFDKYIELAPGNPNPYDSKGDYYMEVKDYGKAYESYMKAHEIDSAWSYKKAMRAKTIADSLSKIKK